MSQFVGVDIGTTRTKVGCYDAEAGRLVALRDAPTAVQDDPWGGRRDAGQVAASVGDLLARLLADPAVRPGDLAGVCVGSVGEEVVLLAGDGSVTAPVLAWFAGHGRETRTPATAWAADDDTFSVFKLLWLARHLPGELAAARTFTSLADFVARGLLAERGAPVFLNVSHSSRTGLLDVRAGVLRDDTLPGLGITGLALPELVGSATVVGRTSGAGVLPAGVPVVTGGHDHMCGAFGAGVRRAGDVYVSAGTSEAQLLLLDELPGTVEPGVDTGIFVAGGLRYLHRATPSGRYYQAWHQLLFDGVGDGVMWTEIAEVVDAVGPARIDADRRTARLAAMPIDVTRAHAMASLLKGLAVEADATTTRLGHLGNTGIADVTVAGVAAGWPTWRRLRQEATGRRLRFVAEPEATVLGVTALAQLGATGRADRPVHLSTVEP
ncbi:FGGY family carbohydrate kinase [Dactylosporangium fulvum]|uniref:FGGY family carbohydrate kinase n=1 Tax=Dactylosporangium fulvum TaxID=53359 RepID=A0ABY5WCK7_9ACTN|nr:FGGY family carbohydrate kinase [Dactylosporangium fulvum]UWP86866.1 FGGY family carbohydrate kinase [Dactylosporangium fulvum]